MTRQIADTVLYEGVQYALTAVAGDGLFEPTDHGFSLRMLSTACWHGYLCEYAVRDGELRLSRLEINLSDDQSQKVLFGAVPTPVPDNPFHDDCPTYTGLDAPVTFSGKMLLGAKFRHAFRANMGFVPAWSYGRVAELVFDNGRLVEAADRSAELAEVRAALAPGGGKRDPAEPVEQWVERTFSLSYDYSWPGHP